MYTAATIKQTTIGHRRHACPSTPVAMNKARRKITAVTIIRLNTSGHGNYHTKTFLMCFFMCIIYVFQKIFYKYPEDWRKLAI